MHTNMTLKLSIPITAQQVMGVCTIKCPKFLAIEKSSIQSIPSTSRYHQNLRPCLLFSPRPPLHRNIVRLSATGGPSDNHNKDKSPTPDPENDPDTPPKTLLDKILSNKELGTLFISIVTVPAITGTAAVTASFFLPGKIDPLGGLHLNLNDALTGLKYAIPVMLLDAAIMLPNYAPGQVEKPSRIAVRKRSAAKFLASFPNARIVEGELDEPTASLSTIISGKYGNSKGSDNSKIASTSSSNKSNKQQLEGEDGAQLEMLSLPTTATATAPAESQSPKEQGTDFVTIERMTMGPEDQHPLIAALYRQQREKSLYNLGRMLSFPSEILLVSVIHLAEEMLYRAVLLTFAVGWTLDRMYEAGADEYINIVTLGGGGGMFSLSTPQAAALIAALACSLVDVGIYFQKNNRSPLPIDKAAIEEITKSNKMLLEALEKQAQGAYTKRMWTGGIETTRTVFEWAALSSSFLLTGNLLAPYVGAIASDALFSVYQRARLPGYQKEEDELISKLQEKLKTMQRAKVDKVSKYTPPSGKSYGEEKFEDDKNKNPTSPSSEEIKGEDVDAKQK